MHPKQHPPPSPPNQNTNTYFHQNPHPLYTPLLTTCPPYTISSTLSTTPHITPRDPFFTLTTKPPSPAVHDTLFLHRTSPTPIGHMLLHIGPGVNGQIGIAHGGFLATVLDEVCGTLIDVAGLDGGRGMFTVYLGVGYKRAVLVPEVEKDKEGSEGDGGKGTVILATARLKRVEGRKVFVEGEIRDMAGEVCTTVEAVFVKKGAAL
ncbi:HotDog domain-containing protein [Aspergillus spectabilis]